MTFRYRAAVLWLALLFSNEAFAHAPIEGIGSFYNGLLHPILIPAHLILLVAIGLFIGQQKSSLTEMALGAFAIAAAIGLILAWFEIGTQVESFVLVLSTAIGLLIAIKPEINRYVAIIIGALAGLALGMDSAQEALAGKEKLASLFGSGIAIYFIALYPMALADYFDKKPWQKIGVRVVGSWLAASSLLVLTLQFAPTT